nr:hypothetical protein Iba_chr06dCG7470 [Ipomoea batatas]
MALVVAMAGGASCSLLLRSAAFIGGGCGDWGERRSSESGGVEGKKQSESFWAVACGIWQEEATGCVYEMQVFLGCGFFKLERALMVSQSGEKIAMGKMGSGFGGSPEEENESKVRRSTFTIHCHLLVSREMRGGGDRRWLIPLGFAMAGGASCSLCSDLLPFIVVVAVTGEKDE